MKFNIIHSKASTYVLSGLLVFLIMALLSAGCSDDNPTSSSLSPASINPLAKFVDHSGCTMEYGKTPNAEFKSVAYSYDGRSVLELTDISSWFNCCVIRINGYIWYHDREIEILETEYNEPNEVCDCYCPYDINYQMIDLPPGSYTIRLRISSDMPFVYWADLPLNLPTHPVSDTLRGELHFEMFVR